MKIPKLLAPVRDEVSLRAALAAGADAVYFGVGELNMRMNSKGIFLEELPRIVKLAHSKSAEVHVTLNVIVYNEELAAVEEILKKIKAAGADAVICWDFAVIQQCRKLGVPFNISTQAGISNAEAARFYEKLGARCLVLARECTLKQIKEIKENINCAIEVFCHGAMCVSVSGRCFMSQFLECRSANRGECFQPCRREYRVIDKEGGHELDISNGFVMSPKDLRTLNILEELVDTGSDILKIEGRGRSPEYIKTVTKSYRRALDAIKENNYTDEFKRELLKEVDKVYNRGFATGFLFGRPAAEGWADCRDSRAAEKKEYLGKITNYFKKNQVAEIVLSTGELAVGDKIQIQGNKTGLERMAVTELKCHADNLFTFPCGAFCRRNDEVYKIVSVK